MIIYMFKIQKGIVPNPGINFGEIGRTGIKARIPNYNREPNWIQSLRYDSFNYIGPKLFNLLPNELNNFEAPEGTRDIISSFKNKLDKFLSRFPDEPTVYGLRRAANSNSLLDQQYYCM